MVLEMDLSISLVLEPPFVAVQLTYGAPAGSYSAERPFLGNLESVWIVIRTGRLVVYNSCPT